MTVVGAPKTGLRVRNRTVDSNVEVAADAIVVEADHMRVQALQEGRGGVTFLGHVVQVDRETRDRGRSAQGVSAKHASDEQRYDAQRGFARGVLNDRKCWVRLPGTCPD